MRILVHEYERYILALSTSSSTTVARMHCDIIINKKVVVAAMQLDVITPISQTHKLRLPFTVYECAACDRISCVVVQGYDLVRCSVPACSSRRRQLHTVQ